MYTIEVVRLNITSWVGTFAIGAEHWYGKLYWHTKKGQDNWHEYELKYILTSQQAKKLNRNDKYCIYKSGEASHRFFSNNDVIKTAKSIWKKKVPHGKVLLSCDTCACGVCEILSGPAKLKQLSNKLWKKDQQEGYNWNNRREEIDQQWQLLFNEFGFLEYFME